MKKLFIYILVGCVLISNTDLIRALAYYLNADMTLEESMQFMQQHGVVERFYMLAGNAFNYASVIFCWIAFKKKPEKIRFIGLYVGLFASFLYFVSSTYELWLPIAQGAQMSDNFALGFLKITLYTNIIGFICVLLGFNIGKYYLSKAVA